MPCTPSRKNQTKKMTMVNEAMMQLSAQDREAITMFHEGYTQEEMAAHFAIRRPAMQRRIERAKDKLQKIINGEPIR